MTFLFTLLGVPKLPNEGYTLQLMLPSELQGKVAHLSSLLDYTFPDNATSEAPKYLVCRRTCKIKSSCTVFSMAENNESAT